MPHTTHNTFFAVEHTQGLRALRTEMVREQLVRRGIRDDFVLRAMGEVPRELFVPEGYRARAYEDRPLPIGYGVTISQPYMVALMTELAQVTPDDVVLDVGSGSGYQAAVLGQLGAEVISLEIIAPLAEQASRRMRDLGYSNVHVRWGDGYLGCTEQAPYEAIIVAAAPAEVPEPLKEQLTLGGRLVLPVGEPGNQTLKVITRMGLHEYEEIDVLPVTFVPMVGERPGDSFGCAFGANRTAQA